MAILGYDRYDVDARLKPALFAALPLAITIAVWLVVEWPTITALLSLAGLCGFTYLLSRLARRRGRLVQDELFAELGGLPSTILLRNRDTRISSITKQRYHHFLRSKGLRVPLAAEEAADPIAADLAYASCGDYLKEMTRDKTKFTLLFQENIDFGYRRNLRGLRPAATLLLMVLLFVNGVVIAFKSSAAPELPWKEIVLEAVLLATLALWIWAVSKKFVLDAGWAYGARLLASCEQIDPAPRTSSIITPAR